MKVEALSKVVTEIWDKKISIQTIVCHNNSIKCDHLGHSTKTKLDVG